ncbi:ChrR family anti-sigma-E factor [Alteromonas sp. ASW11-19]|uniref:ChrR family anti-sigma-E factor n=1 Tax=Alteromonas salexigens TaxID=2982530 RepID=A0ABT2VV98_9ALTE|nr:ChrR family anti-sigma-E factor [Alteromonas salexigens]MCU7555779.1 ChrR family anti-sigma-E factor [Alteromonas salexigens]
MIKFHPSLEQLSEFAEGSLSSVEAIMVSAHCDMCERCQQVVASETERLAEDVLDSFDARQSSEFERMLSSITQLPPSDKSDRPSRTTGSCEKFTIELDGRQFVLPRTLRRFVDKTGNWSSLVGRLWQAPVDLGFPGVANFIYMERGGSVPEHTHRGTEYTLVLDGEFRDGINAYDTGDFIYMDGDHTHAPKSEATKGCLVFSVVDQPLHFTSGLARLLNPFSHMFFR